jgi:hypothetical protein
MHYALYQRNGSYTARKIASMGSRMDVVRKGAFSESDDCVILDGSGERPKIEFNGGTEIAARVAWTLRHGDPGENFVLHACSLGSGSFGCVNVRHLYLGTPQENSDDTVRNWRHRFGESHPMRKLTDAAVREIRGGGSTDQEFADKYGVHPDTVALVRLERTWTHL